MKPLPSCLCAAALLLLAACSSLPSATDLPSGPELPLVDRQGKLTEEGSRLRSAGVHLVASDRNAEAYAQWLPLAKAGHAESQYNMGLMTRQGLGTAVDVPASVQWMRRAAAAHHPEALLALAMLHARGADGVEKNPAEALKLCLSAAGLGDAKAAFYAGEHVYYGIDVTPDAARGIDLLTQAAQSETPSVKAQSLLGRIFTQGSRPDYLQALYWLELAAAAEDSEAQLHLGELHQHGLGVPRNLNKALGWYLRSAQQDNAAALNAIGQLYLKGDGVRKNLKLARQHFEKAQEKGSTEAAANLASLPSTERIAMPARSARPQTR